MLIIQRPEIEAGDQNGNTQSFTISPLEPGFGHTLGNSLRRTLLSSIPGAAVTQVRFDGETRHEFTVIDGVKHAWEAEDMLNLPVRPDGIIVQHFNADREKRVRFVAAETNWVDCTGVDRGCGFEQLENAPGYRP